MPKTILIVEDDHTMRQLLTLHLTGAGYAVRTPADGIEAIRVEVLLQKVRRHLPVAGP